MSLYVVLLQHTGGHLEKERASDGNVQTSIEAFFQHNLDVHLHLSRI